MSDGRRRRQAKHARRDARRTKARERKARDESSLADVVRGALAGGHPLGLLSLVSVVIRMTVPDPLSKLRTRQWEPLNMDDVIASFTRERCRETTALLAVLAELMPDETDRQDRCRREVAERKDSLPEWISRLPQIRVHRAVRATHVLGDEDELLIGAQLAGDYELTCVVHVNHNMFSRSTTHISCRSRSTRCFPSPPSATPNLTSASSIWVLPMHERGLTVDSSNRCFRSSPTHGRAVGHWSNG
jgi:hypothetical protein